MVKEIKSYIKRFNFWTCVLDLYRGTKKWNYLRARALVEEFWDGAPLLEPIDPQFMSP